MHRVDFQHTRRNTASLDRLIDRGENNVAITRDVNDYTAAGQVGHNLVFRRLQLRGGPRVAYAQQRQNGSKAND